MHHPKNRAERRRINKKKSKQSAEHEEAVRLRLDEEAREVEEALRELRIDHKQEPSD